MVKKRQCSKNFKMVIVIVSVSLVVVLLCVIMTFYSLCYYDFLFFVVL